MGDTAIGMEFVDRAREFNANYEVTAQGDVVYVFGVSGLPPAGEARRWLGE
jgi:hypothetical protein